MANPTRAAARRLYEQVATRDTKHGIDCIERALLLAEARGLERGVEMGDFNYTYGKEEVRELRARARRLR